VPAAGGTLVACALQREVAVLRRHLAADCEFVVTGVGARRTRARLEKHFRAQAPSLFIFTGTAGQLDPALTMGQVVCPEAWCLKGGDCFPAHPGLVEQLRGLGWEIAGQGLTVSLPVVRARSRRRLHQRFGACICDMEAAAALEVAAAFRIPCLAPKVVSDTAASGLLAFWSHFDANLRALAEYLQRLLASVNPRMP